jgi:hypothetical protein
MQTRNMNVWVLNLYVPHETTGSWFFDTEDKALQIKNLVDELLPLFPEDPYRFSFSSPAKIQEAYTKYREKIGELYVSVDVPDFFTREEMESIFDGMRNEGELAVQELALDVY